MKFHLLEKIHQFQVCNTFILGAGKAVIANLPATFCCGSEPVELQQRNDSLLLQQLPTASPWVGLCMSVGECTSTLLSVLPLQAAAAAAAATSRPSPSHLRSVRSPQHYLYLSPAVPQPALCLQLRWRRRRRRRRPPLRPRPPDARPAVSQSVTSVCKTHAIAARSAAAAAQCRNTHILGGGGATATAAAARPTQLMMRATSERAHRTEQTGRGLRACQPSAGRRRVRALLPLLPRRRRGCRRRRRRCTARHCIFALHLGRHGGRGAASLRPPIRGRAVVHVRLPAAYGATAAAPTTASTAMESERARESGAGGRAGPVDRLARILRKTSSEAARAAAVQFQT